jgi:hypothetical protein
MVRQTMPGSVRADEPFGASGSIEEEISGAATRDAAMGLGAAQTLFMREEYGMEDYRYRQIEQHLLQQISSGTLAPGARLPSLRHVSRAAGWR